MRDKCRKKHDFKRYFGVGDAMMEANDADKCNRCGHPRIEVQSPEYLDALQEIKAITARILGCEPDDHQWKYVGERDDSGLDWWRCKICDKFEQEVELERDSIIAPRRWRAPNGSIHGEAYSDEGVDLLLHDPEEYFRLRDIELRKVGIIK